MRANSLRKPRKLSREQLDPYQVYIRAADPHRPPEEPSGEPVLLDWASIFGNSQPVEVEVGFGKGLFLMNTAAKRPEANFFGIEIVRKYQLLATDRIARRELRNARTACLDAKKVLKHHITPGSVSVVHVYFPDPWWKNRHQKRLLFTPDFAIDVRKVLALGGKLSFVSDVLDYFVMVQETLAAMPGFRELPKPAEAEPEHDMDYLTNFERKFRQEGRPIHRALYEAI
jgi:tRNA (guanine-N7-)-methyltransferase